MTQPNLFSDEKQQQRDTITREFFAFWRGRERFEGRSNRAPLHVNEAVVVDGFFTIAVVVDGKQHGVNARATLDEAFRDLWTQHHGDDR